MNIKKISIALCIGLIAVTFLSVAFIKQYNFAKLNQYISIETKVAGLKPNTVVTYVIEQDVNALLNQSVFDQDQFIRSDVITDADGNVYLPSFQPHFKKYSILIEDEQNPVDLYISYNHKTERMDIKGSGFDKFTSVFIENNNAIRETKTDWSGLFADNNVFPNGNFEKNNPVKLAFQGFALDKGIFDDNPMKLEVVIGIGGGPPGDPNVNVYNPVIHDYNCGRPTTSTEPIDIFYVSTCDAARVETPAFDEGTCTGGPPCTSSADGFVQLIVHPLMLMGEQLSAVMMQQMPMIGSLIDAKEQNEAQRDMSALVAAAHKDYHPSEQMCRFGSYIRSVSHAEEKADTNKKAFNKILSDFYRAPDHMSSSEGYALDMQSRLEQFKTIYCDPNDNNGALWEMCRGINNDPATNPSPSGTALERVRYNKDIDYFRTLDKPLTLDVDFNNAAASETEEDLIALAKNLYWPKAGNLASADQYDQAFEENYSAFLATRQIMSKYSLAHNSFAHIVGMKSRSTNPLAATSGSAHMKALLRDFGISDADIEIMWGNDPSYYAQMEVLTKKIYQNPTFYTNLYDKPVNVDRINASLRAFQLMQNRDIYESQLRQEMLISMLVEDGIMDRVDEVNAKVRIMTKKAKPIDPTGF